MTNRELIDKLKALPVDDEVIVFTDGKLYPTLAVCRTDDGRIEIGCGWGEIEDDK